MHRLLRFRLLVCVAAVLAASALAAAVSIGQVTSTGVPSGDWLTFDYNAQRTGVGPANTGITAANLHHLKRLTVKVPGTVDSSPVALHNLMIGGRPYDVFFVTTSYGRTLAINAANGRLLWQFAPASVAKLEGSAQITTATPIIDPGLGYIYVSTPDGFIHKLLITTGRQVWSTRVTWDPTHEKIAGSLNISGGSLIVVTDGYDGDAPPYQGHVVTLALASGRITHVWNTLCSNIKTLIHPPSRCPASDSAIWGRPGSVIVPSTGNILVATGNGPFNGRTDWGDSVLELSPTLKLLHNWTPANQEQMNQDDTDLGSTEPALLPVKSGPPLAVQGGKDGLLRLLDINRLDGTAGGAGPRTGGELQTIKAPGPTDIYSQPAVWQSGPRIYVFVSDGAGTAAFTLTHRRLRLVWQNSTPGTSPLVAGGLLYVYNEVQGQLVVLNPRSGRVQITLPAAQGHWNSPIVVGGRIILPEGNDNDHLTSGTIDIYHLPGL
jgi:outer membrane protein assembly factor BamB